MGVGLILSIDPTRRLTLLLAVGTWFSLLLMWFRPLRFTTARFSPVGAMAGPSIRHRF